MNERRYNTLVKTAKNDLACEDVKYEYVSGDLHRMSGCSARAEYLLKCGGPICNWVPLPHKQVSFEMNCPADQLHFTELSKTSYGVEGCGKRMTYLRLGNVWSPQTSSTTTESPAPAASTPAPGSDL